MKDNQTSTQARRWAFAIALSYAVGGSMWILCSDLLLHLFFSGVTSNLYGGSTLKGLGFVGVSAGLIYWLLVRRESLPEHYSAERLKNRAALKALLDHVPSPCALYNAQGSFAFVNKALCEVSKIPRERYIGKHDEEVFGAPFAQRYLGALRDAFETGKTQQGSISYKTDTAEEHHYLMTYIPLLDESGRVDGLLAMTFDFSGQRKVEQALHHQQEELSQIINLLPHLIFAKDAEGRFLMANEAFAQFHGLPLSRILGQKTLGLFPNPEDAEKFIHQDRLVMETDKPLFNLEVAQRRYDGVMRQHRVTKIPYTTGDSERALLGVVTDVTEASVQAEALRESEERFRTMVERSVDALFVYTENGEIVSINERAGDYLDVSNDEVAGKNISEVLALSTANIDESHLYLDGSRFDTVLTGGNGYRRPVEVRVGTLQQSGRLMYLAEARDITDRLEQERERNLYARFGLALSRADSSTEVAEAIYEATSAIFKVDAFLVSLRKSGQARYQNVLKLDTENGQQVRYPLGEFSRGDNSPIADVYKGKSMLINRKTGRSNGLRPFGMTSKASASLMYVPLQIRGRVVAIASAQSYTADAYNDADLQQFQRIVDLAAPALERCRSDVRATVFSRLGKELAAVRTARETGQIIAREADHLVGWDSCVLGLYSPGDDLFSVIYSADIIDGVKAEIEHPPSIKHPTGMLRKALQSGPSLLLRDELPERGTYSPIGIDRPSASLMWVPIVGRGGITGALSLQSYSHQAFDEADLESVIALADHCSTALERTAVEIILKEREDRYRRAIEASGGIAYQLDYTNNEYVFVGEGIQGITGVSAPEFTPQLFDSMVEETHIMPDSIRRAEMVAGVPEYSEWHAEVRLRTRLGEGRWLSDRSVQIHDATGRPIGAIGILRDITNQKMAETDLRASEERYALAARGANDGLWDWDINQNKCHFSSRWKQMLGYPEADISDSPEEWFGRVHPEDSERMQVELQAHIGGLSEHFESEFRMAHADGSYRWMLVRGIAIGNEEGHTIRMAGSQTDTTERKEAQNRLQHDTLHDALTGLPNRTLLMDRIGRSLERCRRKSDYRFALIFMDLDRFKTINDSLGHITGDLVLKTVASRLLASLRPGDTVARFAGDEFAMVLEDVGHESELTPVARRIQEAVSEPMQLEGHEVITTTSVGIAISSPSYDRPEDMLRDADNALYRAKASGAGRWQLFDTSMHTNAVQTLALEADLRRAVDRGQIKLYYQPVVALGSGKIERFEALARWIHPDRGMVPPDVFIPLAEEMGLISQLSEHVMRQACMQSTAWDKLIGDRDLGAKINVNLSARLFTRSNELVDMLAGVGDECTVNPHNIGLEITESALITGPDEARRALQKMKEAGFLLYLDDFGTGYSSLSYLSQYRFDMVKIDRSFVMRMTEPGPERDIVQAIMVLAGSLRMGVVAEGVETVEQLEIVRSIGCDSAQGYFFSAALPPDEATRMLLSSQEW